jgi:hypothetical protein
MKKQDIENINHSEKKNQVAVSFGELERWFKEFYSAGCLNFEIIQKNDKRPLSKKAHLKLFGLSDEKISELLKQGINDKEFGKLVSSGLVSREKYFSAFMEAIRRGYNLAVVCGRMENFADTGKIRYLIGIDIDVDGHLRQRFEKELKEKGDKFGEFPEDKELLKEINQRRNELLQKILQRFPFLDFLIVKSGTGYHLYVILEVSEQFIDWLENTKTKGKFYGIRRQNEYFLLAGSRRSENVRYEYYSGKLSILSDENLAKELVLFCANDGKVVEFQEIKESKTIITRPAKPTKAKLGLGANFSFSISDEEYEWLKEKLKERYFHLWKILELGYEGESAFVGQKRDFDRSRFEQALARALFEIYYDEGKYFEYSDDEMKSNVAGFLERIPSYKVFGRKEMTKVRERGEKYLSATVEKAFDYFQRRLNLTDYLREGVQKFALDWIRKWFESVLSNESNNQYEALHLNLVPGSGKTKGLVKVISEFVKGGRIGSKTKIILVYQTKDLAEEVRKDLEAEGVRVLFLKGRDKDSCLKFGDQFRRRLAEMGGNHAFYCKFVCELRKKCGYMMQQEKLRAIKGIFQGQSEYIDFGVSEIAEVIITTYDYFCEWDEILLSISKIVIFDDVVPTVKEVQVPVSEIVRTYELIKQNKDRLRGFQVDKVLEVLENVEKKRKGKIDFDFDFDDDVPRELKEILEYLLSFSNQDIEKIPNFHIAELLKYIKRFGVVKTETDDGFIYYKFKQFDRLFHSLWLCWTFRSDLIQLALSKSIKLQVVEKRADVVFRETIEIELMDKSATFTKLKDKKNLKEIIDILRDILKKEKEKKILIVVPSEIEGETKSALQQQNISIEQNISIIHYWGSETRGVNKFEDYDVVILVALPIPNVYEVRVQNSFLKKLAEKKGVELKEDIASDVKECSWQIINRLRPFQKKDKNKKVKVYFVAKFSGKNNQIGSAVKKFLFSFKEGEVEEEEEENQILGLYEIGRKFYSQMKGLIPKLLFFEDKKREIELKEIGSWSSEAKGFLWGLKERFPYFPYILSDNGTIKKEGPKDRDKRRYYKVCKKIQKAEKLEFKIFKILYLKIQRKGRRKYDVEMDIGRTEIWGFAKDEDLDEFRKMLYEKSGILIYAVINEDGKERILNDYWTQEKIKELELLKERFNKFNILCSIQEQQEIQQFKTRNIKKIEEYDKVIEEGLKRRKERLEKLLEEYRSRRENEKDKDLLDYPDIAIEICEIFEEIWAEHNAKKLISKLSYYDTS